MKKIIAFSILALVATGLLYYFMGEQGIFGGILGTLALGGNSAMNKLKEKGSKLDKDAEAKRAELKLIQEEKDNLKVEDKTPEEEKDYWKDV